LIKDNKILLYLRQNTGFADGFYSLVAGHVDGNEKVRSSMITEAKEEVGIVILPEDLEITCVMHKKVAE